MTPGKTLVAGGAVTLGLVAAGLMPASAYPPAVGILGMARDCRACHVDNGPWADEQKTVVDILDKVTGKSLRQPDGSFLVSARRGEAKTVVTVVGRVKGDAAPAPERNAWLYVDPRGIGSSSLSKFAPGWEVNLPMSCRLVGDEHPAYPGAHLTALPMTVRPGDAAADADLELQVMLAAGTAVKGKPREGMQGNYLLRKVKLRLAE